MAPTEALETAAFVGGAALVVLCVLAVRRWCYDENGLLCGCWGGFYESGSGRGGDTLPEPTAVPRTMVFPGS